MIEECSSFPITLSLHWPLTLGDMSVFKGMQINELNLSECYEVTGGLRLKWEFAFDVASRPQDITLGLVKLQCMVKSLLIRTLFASVGNIEALQGMLLTSLNLSQTGLKGRPKYQS